MTNKQTAESAYSAVEDELRSISHWMYDNPETAYEEYESSRLLAGFLKDKGFNVTYPAYGLDTAFEATYGDKGPRIVICCEYDALPEVGHACGHNIIATAALGAGVAAAAIADELGLPKTEFGVSEMEGTNIGLTNFTATSESIQFVMTPTRLAGLSMSALTDFDAANANTVRLRFSNLKAGKYDIYVDDTKVMRTNANQIKNGVVLPASFQHAAVNRAYDLTAEKNMMFFHRHRPQNETYLFLFRKHEQGNNAVEVPLFDPIVDGLEQRIQAIQNSTSYRIEIRKS